MSEATDKLDHFYAAINRAELGAISRDFDVDIVRIEPEGFPTSGIYRGVEAVQAQAARGRGSWAEGTCDPEGYFERDDHVVVFLHAWVRLHGATTWTGGRFADGFIFRDGRIVHYQSFAERADALRWAGIDAGQAG